MQANRTLQPIYSIAQALDNPGRLAGECQPRLNSQQSSAQERQAINPAIADLVLELAARFNSNANAAEEKTRMRLLMEDLSERLDADALKAAIHEGKADWRFMPTLAEIIHAAQSFLSDRRQRNREASEAKAQAEHRALPAPVYADPGTDENKAALAFMRGRFAAADKAEGVRKIAVDYAAGHISPAMPQHSDASQELKKMLSRQNA